MTMVSIKNNYCYSLFYYFSFDVQRYLSTNKLLRTNLICLHFPNNQHIVWIICYLTVRNNLNNIHYVSYIIFEAPVLYKLYHKIKISYQLHFFKFPLLPKNLYKKIFAWFDTLSFFLFLYPSLSGTLKFLRKEDVVTFFFHTRTII